MAPRLPHCLALVWWRPALGAVLYSFYSWLPMLSEESHRRSFVTIIIESHSSLSIKSMAIAHLPELFFP